MQRALAWITKWAISLKRQVMVLWFCCQHPRTPGFAKALAVVVVAYALSPIDLIPDFIPILGYLDDAVLLPLGIWLVLRLIPKDVLEECQQQAEAREASRTPRPVNRVAALIIVALWLGLLAAVWGFYVR